MNSWIPDWINENEYPEQPNVSKLEHLNGSECSFWAWQFLRGNAGYQDSYYKNELHIKRMLDDLKAGVVHRGHRDLGAMREKYKICGVPTSPDIQNPNDLMGFTSRRLATQSMEPGINGPYASWQIVSETEVFIRFDLSLPIGAQIENAKKHLTGRKEYLSKRHGFKLSRRLSVRLFKDYLRILDADFKNADLHEIANAILPKVPDDYSSDYLGSKRIRKMLREAKRLRDTDYIFIIAS